MFTVGWKQIRLLPAAQSNFYKHNIRVSNFEFFFHLTVDLLSITWIFRIATWGDKGAPFPRETINLPKAFPQLKVSFIISRYSHYLTELSRYRLRNKKNCGGIFGKNQRKNSRILIKAYLSNCNSRNIACIICPYKK